MSRRVIIWSTDPVVEPVAGREILQPHQDRPLHSLGSLATDRVEVVVLSPAGRLLGRVGEEKKSNLPPFRGFIKPPFIGMYLIISYKIQALFLEAFNARRNCNDRNGAFAGGNY